MKEKGGGGNDNQETLQSGNIVSIVVEEWFTGGWDKVSCGAANGS